MRLKPKLYTHVQNLSIGYKATTLTDPKKNQNITHETRLKVMDNYGQKTRNVGVSHAYIKKARIKFKSQEANFFLNCQRGDYIQHHIPQRKGNQSTTNTNYSHSICIILSI